MFNWGKENWCRLDLREHLEYGRRELGRKGLRQWWLSWISLTSLWSASSMSRETRKSEWQNESESSGGYLSDGIFPGRFHLDVKFRPHRLQSTSPRVTAHFTQTRPSTSFVDHTIDLPWRNFLGPEFGAKFQRKVPLFWSNPNFLTTQFRIGQRKPPALSVQTFRCSTGLWQTSGHATTAGTALAYRRAEKGAFETRLKVRLV